MLLFPEGVLVPNETAAAAVLAALRRRVHRRRNRHGAGRASTPAWQPEDVLERADRLGRRRVVDVDVSSPLGLLAELTHRCPLHCPYCSNPVELVPRADELSTADWLGAFARPVNWACCRCTCPAASRWPGRTCPHCWRTPSGLGCYVNLVT